MPGTRVTWLEGSFQSKKKIAIDSLAFIFFEVQDCISCCNFSQSCFSSSSYGTFLSKADSYQQAHDHRGQVTLLISYCTLSIFTNTVTPLLSTVCCTHTVPQWYGAGILFSTIVTSYCTSSYQGSKLSFMNLLHHTEEYIICKRQEEHSTGNTIQF